MDQPKEHSLSIKTDTKDSPRARSASTTTSTPAKEHSSEEGSKEKECSSPGGSLLMLFPFDDDHIQR